MTDKTIVAYKGFDANWKCRYFQFEVGKTYKHDGDVKLCSSGFHACEFPMDVWNYYPPVDGNNIALVELGGVTEEKENDSKRVGNSIRIKASLSIAYIVSASVEWISKSAEKYGKKSSGDYSKAASSGNYSKAASSGYSSKAASSGYSSTAASSGNYSKAASSGDYSKAACDTNGFACVAGIKGSVKGNAGSALSLGYADAQNRNRIAVAYVGENGIKANVFYRLDDEGNFAEVV
jgi:hypothetical protein